MSNLHFHRVRHSNTMSQNWFGSKIHFCLSFFAISLILSSDFVNSLDYFYYFVPGILFLKKFSNFVDRRLEYATTQVAHCERLVLPKPIPLRARANRSPSTDRHASRGDRGGSVSRGNSASRGTRVMGVSVERKPAPEKKVSEKLPPQVLFT